MYLVSIVKYLSINFIPVYNQPSAHECSHIGQNLELSFISLFNDLIGESGIILAEMHIFIISLVIFLFCELPID